MEILDPDLWNDDGTPKRPSQEYMRRLEEAQDLEAVDPETPLRRLAEKRDAYISYVRAQREFKNKTPASLGDIVHFWYGTGCAAAIVVETEALTHAVTLHVFIPHEASQHWHCDHDELKADKDTWHWPESEA